MSTVTERAKKLDKVSIQLFDELQKLGLTNVKKHIAKFFNDVKEEFYQNYENISFEEVIGAVMCEDAFKYVINPNKTFRNFCIDVLQFLITNNKDKVIINEITWFKPVLSRAFTAFRYQKDTGIPKLLGKIFQLDFNRYKFYDATFALWIETNSTKQLKTESQKKQVDKFIFRLLNHGANPSISFNDIRRKSEILEKFFKGIVKPELLEAEEMPIIRTIQEQLFESVSHFITIYYTRDDRFRTAEEKITQLIVHLFGATSYGIISYEQFDGILELLRVYKKEIVDKTMEAVVGQNFSNNFGYGFGAADEYTDESESESENDEGSFDDEYGFGASADEYDYDDY